MTIRTGVIVAMIDGTDQAYVNRLDEYLRGKFPNVTIAIAVGARNSLVFPFDDGVEAEGYPSVSTMMESHE